MNEIETVYVMRNFATGKYFRNSATSAKPKGFSEPLFKRAAKYKTRSRALRSCRRGFQDNGMLDAAHKMKRWGHGNKVGDTIPTVPMLLEYKKHYEVADSMDADEILDS